MDWSCGRIMLLALLCMALSTNSRTLPRAALSKTACPGKRSEEKPPGSVVGR